jgi:acyl carrier protein
MSKENPFPEDWVRNELTKLLKTEVPGEKRFQSAFDEPIEVSSPTAAEIATLIEQELNLPLSVRKVIRSGGYESVSDAVEHILGAIRNSWRKKHG